MNPTKHLSKTLLSTSIAAVLALTASFAIAQMEDDSALKTYTDPVTGELKVAPKLLSQMSEAEKAQLSDEERKLLEEVQKLIDAEEKERGK